MAKLSQVVIINGNGKQTRGARGPKQQGGKKSTLKVDDENLREVIISPSKELEEAEAQGIWTGRM